MRIWFDVITMSDAIALRSWWNAHTTHNHRIERSKTNPRFWALVRT